MRATAKNAPAASSNSQPATAATPAPAGIEPVSGRNANTRAYHLLRQAVLSGSFRPTQIITLRMVTELLGLGEMPAREALKRLVSEGAFTAMPNRSARVPALERREISQLCELRSLLESNAASLAAENITLHQIEHLRSLHDNMIAAVAKGDLEEYKRLNMAFHFEIYRIADNKPLSDLIETLWLRMAPFISRTINWVTTVPGRFQEIANSRHDELLTAFQNRNAEAARAAMRLDLSDIHETDGYWDAIAEGPQS
jgi:DNA-binding GntR family transcriptional regulator